MAKFAPMIAAMFMVGLGGFFHRFSVFPVAFVFSLFLNRTFLVSICVDGLN